MEMNSIIQRNIYINRIKPFVQQKLIKVLTGQRRVGKSYILLQLIQLIKSDFADANIIYINKEDMAFDAIKDASSLYDFVASRIKENNPNFVFVDEIQDITNFEKALRSLLLKDNVDVYITGSNARMLSGELATYLSGRYIEFPIYSLSYSEFLQFHNLKNEEQSFVLYSKYGGLPFLIHLKLQDDIVFEYLNSIYSTIVYRDVVGRYAIRNVYFLEKLLQFLADNIGQIFSAKNISDYLKSQHTNIAVNQLLTYTKYFSDAFIIDKVSRYDILGKRLLEVGEKYYFENLGIRNSIIGYKIQDKAKIIENIVYNHFKYCGYSVKIGNIKSQEIDFIAERNHEKVYAQVCLTLDNENALQREFGNLLLINDNYKKIVISQDPSTYNTYEGIEQWNILKFLTEFK